MIQLHKLRIFTAFAQIARKQSFVESRGPTRKQNARARTGATTYMDRPSYTRMRGVGQQNTFRLNSISFNQQFCLRLSWPVAYMLRRPQRWTNALKLI